jgi:3-hydroxyisobutyrate dehydrogenase-like beta-hydroxyacid dehydrogenase
MARIAVLGTGIMGGPMARNLLRSGHEVSVWNPTEERAGTLADDGAQVRATLAQFDRAFELDHGDEDMIAIYYASTEKAGQRS